MELIYVWIRTYRNIEFTEFNLSDRFEVTSELDLFNINYRFYIKRLAPAVPLFRSPISSLNGIVGKNGYGKTNLLDLIGMRREERGRDFNNGARYIMIYHIRENLFVIEGLGFKEIDRVIKGIDKIRDFGVKDFMYSLVVRWDEKEQHFSYVQYLQHNDRFETIDILYFKNDTKRDSSNYYMSEQRSEHIESIFFNRKFFYPETIGYYYLYSFILHYSDLSRQSLFKKRKIPELVIRPNFPVRDRMSIRSRKRLNIERGAGLLDSRTALPFEYKQNWMLVLMERYISHGWDLILNREDTSQAKRITDFVSSIAEIEDKKEYLLRILQGIILEIFGEEGRYQAFLELLEKIEAIDEQCFGAFDIRIPIHKKSQNTAITEFLKFYDSHYLALDRIDNLLEDALKITVEPLSSGEQAYVYQFAAIYYGITSKDPDKENAVLLLDEPDLHMHPEWARRFIFELQGLLESLKKQGYKSYQILFTTHSPFLISDLDRNRVICLVNQSAEEHVEPFGKQLDSYELVENIKVKHLDIQTFASNIHTLLTHSFFITSTLGEFARDKINTIITQINQTKARQLNLSLEEIQEMDALIELIGEPVIRDKIREQFNSQFQLNEIKQIDHMIARLQLKKQQLIEKQRKAEEEKKTYDSD